MKLYYQEDEFFHHNAYKNILKYKVFNYFKNIITKCLLLATYYTMPALHITDCLNNAKVIME